MSRSIESCQFESKEEFLFRGLISQKTSVSYVLRKCRLTYTTVRELVGAVFRAVDMAMPHCPRAGGESAAITVLNAWALG